MKVPTKDGLKNLDIPEPKNPGFFQSTFIKILATLISLVVTGAIGYFFATVKAEIAQIKPLESRVTIVETIQKAELIENIKELKETMKNQSTQFGSLTNDIKRIDILIARIEESIKSLEKHK